MQVSMTINGEQVSHDVEPRLLLVHYIRETVGLTGTHWGCDTSNCGACVVLIDGQPVKSCTTLAVMADGRNSVTHYETLEAHRFASLLEVHLETGRTHQIRVHMSALKHPCVGDITYGADPTLTKRLGLERQWLHALKLGFEHPDSGDYVEYESTYPDDLAHALEVIRDEH